jgi:hypothetical protein
MKEAKAWSKTQSFPPSATLLNLEPQLIHILLFHQMSIIRKLPYT